jgi:hypothetical protein
MPKKDTIDRGPFLLEASAFRVFQGGECVASGDFAGCIRVGAAHYWLALEKPTWTVHDGAVDAKKISPITPTLWNKIQDGGSYGWNAYRACWTYGGKEYRLGGVQGKEVRLLKI